MKNWRILSGIALLGVLSAGYAYSQQEDAVSKFMEESIAMNESKIRTGALKASIGSLTPEQAAKEIVDSQVNLAKGYYSTAKDSSKTTRELGTALGKFYSQTASSRSAPQISQVADEASVRLQALQVAQNQRIIEQNDQIIALLKEQNKKGATSVAKR